MTDDPSAWTCTCAAAVPLALGLHHRQQSGGFSPGDAAAVLRALSHSLYEASYAFLLEAILHEARGSQQPTSEGPDGTATTLAAGVRHGLLADLYAACSAPASQACLQQLLCSPAADASGLSLQVSISIARKYPSIAKKDRCFVNISRSWAYASPLPKSCKTQIDCLLPKA